MTRRTRSVAVLATTLVAAASPAVAHAHVTVQPPEAAAGSYAVVQVRVPNEQDDQGTTQVRLQLPPGVTYAAYQPVPGWRVAITKRPAAPGLTVDGEPVKEEVDTVTWRGKGKAGVIAPGQFLEFPLSLRVPDGTEGTELPFKALQTYEDGEVVRWIGAADADLPAPTLTLVEREDDHDGAHRPASAAAADAADADADDGDEGGSDALPIVLGAAGLLAGLAGLGIALANRRRGA